MIKIIKSLKSGYLKQSFTDRTNLSKKAPLKLLSKKLKKAKGRDNLGHISVRHIGGGSKRKYRKISDLNEYLNQDIKVIALEYDPNRSANLAQIQINDNQRRYVIATSNMKVGTKIESFDKRDNYNKGDRAPLMFIPIGIQVCDIELTPGSKSHLARSAGSYATNMALEANYALIKLPSGEIRKINKKCFATLGQISNPDHSNIRIGKAGRIRHMGKRPSVRGKVMSPKAHPHGGGEGVNPIGLKYPKTPWGKVAIGKKTRKNKISDKFIIKRAGKR